MNHKFQDPSLTAAPTPRQQKLEFARSSYWQQLPDETRQACREALARLMCQVISTVNDGPSDQEKNHE